jgi:anti-sigma B factor antagonist
MAVHYEFRQLEPDVIVASLTGQLNLGNRLTDFEYNIKKRIQEGSRKMILDLSGLTYIDSAGLGMVATCAGIMYKAGGKLAVVTAGGKITQMFEITRLNRVVDLHPDFNTAFAALSEASAASPETQQPE